MKRVRPQDARRALRIMWKFVKVQSCANGTIRLTPKWNGAAGLLTRLHAAHMVERLFDIHQQEEKP